MHEGKIESVFLLCIYSRICYEKWHWVSTPKVSPKSNFG